MSTTVTYKGNTIATVNNNTKTLKTAGTMMEDDVTLVDISSSGGITTVTILPEQSVTANVQETSGYSIYLDDITEQLIDGENYIVTIDGDPYTCHATTAWGSIYAGDVDVVWGSPTTALYPFMLGSYANNKTQWGYGDNNAHTLKIERVVSFSAPELISKSITTNGTYDPADDNADGYSEVIVNVSGGGGTTWETLKEGTFTIYSSSPNYMLINSYTTPFLENETYRITWGSDVYVFQTASDGGYSVDGYYVGNAGVVGGQDDGSGATFFIYRDQASRAVAAVTDPAGSKFLRIEKQVSSGGGGNYQVKTNITPTTSSQTITADSGYDALESVQINAMPTGTAGTPTATKGTVSNHAISVTPSVTNSAGYVPSETKTGTAVTVSASELVSGSETKTANGTYDVTNLAQLVVNVSGGTSNVVTGTFKGTTTGAAMDVTLNYSGSGYPVAVMIYPAEGPYNSSGTFYSLIQRYVLQMYAAVKNIPTSTPTYKTGTGNTENLYRVLYSYKSSASSSTSYSNGGASSVVVAIGGDATSSNTRFVTFKSKNSMSVYIASSSYGFAANIDHKYVVLYSS